ncbi:hypothetical protein ACYBO8_26620, partial [Klebsiella pneumoniae]|uniref:hypothetical protein n=1 Tax=Klebsiella pneumoniae TaxID=573 RepID=UPI001CC050E3
ERGAEVSYADLPENYTRADVYLSLMRAGPGEYRRHFGGHVHDAGGSVCPGRMAQIHEHSV